MSTNYLKGNRTMRRMLVISALLLLSAATPAFAADDDGVMGVWEGKFTTPGWESKTLKAKIWGVKGGMWEGKLIVLEKDATLAEGEIADTSPGKEATFGGTLALDGDYFITAAATDGVLKGELAPGRENKKGNIKPSKKAGAPVTFELQRLQVKPPSLGAAPPEGAIVLLAAGKELDAWTTRPEKWERTEQGGMRVTFPSIATTQEFGSCKLHVEFVTPYMPNEGVGSQARGNSGVYVQGRYEIQVLDSFGAAPLNNLCGGIYKIAVPQADAVLPPLTVQTYDIEFHAPKFDAAGKKTQDAELTVLHNGIVIHNRLKLPNATPGGVTETEGPTGPLLLQNHHDSVEYRNIWILPIQD
jgi:hypothetical protein